MAQVSCCQQCGSQGESIGPAGLCAGCLLKLGLEGALGLAEDSPNPIGMTDFWEIPPTGHDTHAPFGSTRAPSRRPRILPQLANEMENVPQILLRNRSGEEGPPVRTGTSDTAALSTSGSRFQLLGEIARGGMGTVLKGRDPDLGRDLAIKVILDRHRDRPEMIRRFVEEAQIGGQLEHPGIVPVHELGCFQDGRLYIAMKLLHGRTLAAVLEERRTSSEDLGRFLGIFEKVCYTMAYAHSRGVIHRDLKPSNIMVGSFGEIQVMDWGLAKVLVDGGIVDEARSHWTNDALLRETPLRTGSSGMESRAGSVLGTPAYMSPEQARGELDTVDERADVFGLGSILCEILTGAPTYTGENAQEICRRAIHADLTETLARLDRCGAEHDLVALAKTCLSPVPKDRPRDAGAVSAALSAYLVSVNERLHAASLAAARAEAHAAAERKRKALAIAAATLVVLMAAVGAIGWGKYVHDRSERMDATTRDVDEAIAEAFRLRDQAVSSTDPYSTKWVEAIGAAKRAKAILSTEGGSPALVDRVNQSLRNLEREKSQAEQEDQDSRLIERLLKSVADLAVHLDGERTDAEFRTAFIELLGVDPDQENPQHFGEELSKKTGFNVDLASVFDQWSFIRMMRRPPNIEGARHLSELAKFTDTDPWRNQLREALEKTFTDREGTLKKLEELAATAVPEDLPATSISRLAFGLNQLGHEDTALDILRRGQRVHPDDFWLNWDLANALSRGGKVEEAIRYYSILTAIRPQSALAVLGLGSALHRSGRLEETRDTCLQAIRQFPDNSSFRVRLAAVYFDLGQSEEANQQLEQAKEVQKDGRTTFEVFQVLADRGDFDGAIKAVRDRLAVDPNDFFASELLGRALLEVGKPLDAISVLEPLKNTGRPFGPMNWSLARAYLEVGQFEKAVELLSSNPIRTPPEGRIPSPTAGLVRQAKQMMDLDLRLEEFLKGHGQSAEVAEQVVIAKICKSKGLYDSSLEFWQRAISQDPALVQNLSGEIRVSASIAAVLAAKGDGSLGTLRDPIACASARTQALNWMKAELMSNKVILAAGDSAETALIARRIGKWQLNPGFAPVRDPDSLAKLTRSEQDEWNAFWKDVDGVKIRARPTAWAANRFSFLP